MNIRTLAKVVERFAIDHSPVILTGVAVAGTITTAFLTHRATKRATEYLYTAHEEHDDLEYEDGQLTFRCKARLTWKLYIPPISVAALTVLSTVGANRIENRRAAALAAAYSLSEKAFEEYREKIVEKIGFNKEREARDEIAEQHVRDHPLGHREVIITGGGDVLCYDDYTGRYFNSDMDTLRRVQNEVNYTILNHNYASLNDFYNKIGLSNISTGEEVGWNTDHPLELYFTTTMSDDQRPCIAMRFQVSPVRHYFRSH